MTEAEQIAAFLATRGATQCDAAPAYGVDAATDKARRMAAREASRFESIERASENHMQRVREERGYYRS
jgi:hypothetical protein